MSELGFEYDRQGGASWARPPTPRVLTCPTFSPADLPTTLAVDFRAPAAAAVSQGVWKSPVPRVVKIGLGPMPLSVRTFCFREQEMPPENGREPAVGERKPAPSCGHTRLPRPHDLVRLEDRLEYLLQPPLETLLGEQRIDFPQRPFPFQMQGIAFLFASPAAVLADEMGLGKTMQAIAAIRLLLHRGEIRRVLLVCPKPLLSSWQREFVHWAPEIPLAVIEGDQAHRAWQWQCTESAMAVHLANYELVCRDRPIFESYADRVRFDLMVLDEAQRIKNPGSQTSLAVRAINSARRWALTGTPVENRPDDLVGIFDFLVPRLLHVQMKPRRMGQVAGDYILRRSKEQVLKDLPPKLYRDAELELTPAQRQTYQLAENDGVLRLSQMGDAVTIQHVFELVLRLKQICNFDPATGESAKLERLEADLEEVVASGRKAIVFSQWVDTIRRLAGHLERLGPLEYHGQISTGRREAVVDRFRRDPTAQILLMSYGAGGVGLNLQCANYVFLFDRWWNPAVEDQAVNRAHRIGVDGPVTVSRFLVLATIEERIERILQEKRDLFATIFSQSDGPAHGLSQEEVFGLFDLRGPGGRRIAA